MPLVPRLLGDHAPGLRGAPGQILYTDDGVRISAHHDRPRAGGPAAAPEDGLCFVVVHGFTRTWRCPHIREIVGTLRDFGGVVTFDLRGHGSSGGRSTVGDAEPADLRAAVRWARVLGYRRVVTLGFSLGAAVVLRQAGEASEADRPDAVIAVSAPSRWNYRGTSAMRLVQWGIGTAVGRAVLALAYRTRISSSGWDPVPRPPDVAVAGIAPTPLLLVHGDADGYFPLDHARWLAEAAGPGAVLWVEPGMGHAESAATPALVSRMARWAVAGECVAVADRSAAGEGAGAADRSAAARTGDSGAAHGEARGGSAGHARMRT